MEIIVHAYSDYLKDISKFYFEQNGIRYHDTSSLKEIISILDKRERSLLVIESNKSSNEFREMLVKIKSVNPFCEIIGVFLPDSYNSVADFVNLKLIDGVGFASMKANEFGSLINTFINPKKIINQVMENISDKDYVVKDILSMEYIHDLIYGNIDRIKTLKEISKLMGLTKVPQLVLTIQCDDFWNKFESLDNRERYKVKRKILNTVRNALENKCRGVAATLVGTDKIVVLIDCYPMEGSVAENFAVGVAQGVKEYVREKTSYTVTIGISSFCKDYKDLWKAYDESFKALSYSFIRGGNCVIRYDETKSADDSEYQKYLNQFEQNLIRCISGTTCDSLDSCFSDICRFLTINNYNAEVIKSIIIKILFEVVQYCYNIGVDFSFLSKAMIKLMVEILKTNSFKNIENIGKGFLESLFNEVKKLRDEDKNTGMNTAAAYINKYYHTNLTLEEVADVCGLSHFHFSRVFKNYYGVNFIQYLTDLRINKAKDMLLDSDATVEDISEKVGYREVGYFSRTFKKVSGMSPSQFRRNTKQQKSTNIKQ